MLSCDSRGKRCASPVMTRGPGHNSWNNLEDVIEEVQAGNKKDMDSRGNKDEVREKESLLTNKEMVFEAKVLERVFMRREANSHGR